MTRTRSGHDGGQTPRRPRMSSSASRVAVRRASQSRTASPSASGSGTSWASTQRSHLVPGHVGREDGLGEPRVREATDQGENDRRGSSSVVDRVEGCRDDLSGAEREETGARLPRHIPGPAHDKMLDANRFHKGQEGVLRWPLSARRVHGPCVRWWGSSHWPCGAHPPARPSCSATTSPASRPAGSRRPIGQLNAAIQEYHYLPHRGVPLGPWANAICHLDAWAVGEEDGEVVPGAAHGQRSATHA